MVAAFCLPQPTHASIQSNCTVIRHITHSMIDARALVRLQCDHVNRSLVPSFYRYLQAQDQDSQINGGKEFHESIEGLVELLERTEKEVVRIGGVSGAGERKALAVGLGLWIPENEEDLGLVDVMAGPCK